MLPKRTEPTKQTCAFQTVTVWFPRSLRGSRDGGVGCNDYGSRVSQQGALEKEELDLGACALGSATADSDRRDQHRIYADLDDSDCSRDMVHSSPTVAGSKGVVDRVEPMQKQPPPLHAASLHAAD